MSISDEETESDGIDDYGHHELSDEDEGADDERYYGHPHEVLPYKHRRKYRGKN